MADLANLLPAGPTCLGREDEERTPCLNFLQTSCVALAITTGTKRSSVENNTRSFAGLRSTTGNS